MKTLILALLALLAPSLFAQEPWPSRPLTILVAYGPGVGPDLAARAVADRLGAALGQPVVVINRPGNNGLIGGEEASRARPDGYTLFLGDDGLFAIVTHLYRNLRFSPHRDFTPIASLVENQFLLGVRPELPVNDLQGFIEHARQASPPLAYGSSGSGGQAHLTMERMRRLAGIELLHVPFRTGGQAAMAIVSGDIAAAFVGASAAGHIRAGRLRIIATTGPSRSKALPDVPALNEVFPGLEMTNWQALFAPAGTPRPVLERLEQEVRRIVAAEDFIQRVGGSGDMRALNLGSEALAQRIRRDHERYGRIVESLGLKPD
jgi:tripartite-type tricarboxylate transporter receptor subunit TctC